MSEEKREEQKKTPKLYCAVDGCLCNGTCAKHHQGLPKSPCICLIVRQKGQFVEFGQVRTYTKVQKRGSKS